MDQSYCIPHLNKHHLYPPGLFLINHRRSVLEPRQINVGAVGILPFILSLLFSGLVFAEDAPDTSIKKPPSIDTLIVVPTPSDSLKSAKDFPPAPTRPMHPVLLHSQPAATAVKRDTSADSAKLLFTRDSLLEEERLRRRVFHPDHVDSVNRQVALSGDLFRSDATSWYDVPFIKQRTVLPKLGIAGCFNRLLLYGNTAPMTRIYSGTGLLYQTADIPLYAEDASRPNTAGSFSREMERFIFNLSPTGLYLRKPPSSGKPEFLMKTFLMYDLPAR